MVTAGSAFGQAGDPLGGPSVEVDAVPGQESTLTGDVERGVRPVPFREFLRSLTVLDASTESLSADQRAQVDAITETFFREWRVYEREHADEVGELRTLMRSMRDDAMGADERFEERVASARERSRAIRKGGPDADGAQKKVWALLSDEQRELVGAELSAWRAQQEQRRGERYLDRQARKREAAAGGVPTDQVISDERINRMRIPDRMKERLLALPPEERADAIQHGVRTLEATREAVATGSIDDQTLASLDLPDRAKRRLDRLSPEQRAAALGRMLESRERGGGRDRPRGGGLDRDRENPAPNLDRVNVPKPDPDDSKEDG